MLSDTRVQEPSTVKLPHLAQHRSCPLRPDPDIAQELEKSSFSSKPVRVSAVFEARLRWVELEAGRKKELEVRHDELGV